MLPCFFLDFSCPGAMHHGEIEIGESWMCFCIKLGMGDCAKGMQWKGELEWQLSLRPLLR